jgi:hypothetical protein
VLELAAELRPETALSSSRGQLAVASRGQLVVWCVVCASCCLAGGVALVMLACLRWVVQFAFCSVPVPCQEDLCVRRCHADLGRLGGRKAAVSALLLWRDVVWSLGHHGDGLVQN